MAAHHRNRVLSTIVDGEKVRQRLGHRMIVESARECVYQRVRLRAAGARPVVIDLRVRSVAVGTRIRGFKPVEQLGRRVEIRPVGIEGQPREPRKHRRPGFDQPAQDRKSVV